MTDGQTSLYGTDLSDTAQRTAFRSGAVPVAVYGLGKMGLPLAAVFADVCGNVTGVDIDSAVVDRVNAGESHVTGEPGLASLLTQQVENGRLRATTDGANAARDARVHVVIVPTLLTDDRTPDLSSIEAVVDAIGAGLDPGDLVLVESTLPPGTCSDVIQPHLEATSGLEGGSFGLAFCPERTASGTALRDIRGQYPKVVGGIDGESARAATVVYDELSSNEIHVVSDTTTAESVKVFEGVYRDVNIALSNQLAETATELDISVREVIETTNHIPMCHLHDPGPGVGGHCIPFYPHFLLSHVETPLSLVELGRETNDRMPAKTVALLEDHYREHEGTRGLEGASVLVLGFTYRPAVAETRASPALGVVDALHTVGADVWGCDPIVDPAEFGVSPVAIEDLSTHTFDAAILVTPQPEFEQIPWADLEPMVILDSRDVLELASTHHDVRTLGGARESRPLVVGNAARTPDDSVGEELRGSATIGRPTAFDAPSFE